MGTRVLVAEDEPLIARSFADLLEVEGYDVDLAPDGAEALDVARRLGDALGALVTDLRMPRMGGEDLIHALRAERSGLPVVVVTGSPPRGGEATLRRGAAAAGGARPAVADRVEAAADAPACGAVAAADTPATDFACSFFSDDAFSFGPGARPAALPGAAPFRSTGDDAAFLIIGGAATGCVHGRGGDILVGGPGEGAWMEGGTANDAHGADDAASAGGHWGGHRVAVLFGDRVAHRPDEGWDGVWAGVDLTPPGLAERPSPTGGARRGQGHEASDLFVGNGEDNRAVRPGGGEMRRGGSGDTHLVNGRGDPAA